MGKVSSLLNKRIRIGNPDRVWSIVIGSGLALSPIHNQHLTDWMTNAEGEVMFFLPAFGTALWLIGSLGFVVWNWECLNWGSKYITIPLGIIVIAMGVSGIGADSLGGKFAPALMGVSMFALYLVGRTLGKDMFVPLAVGAGIASLGIFLSGMVNPGDATGGLVFERNYDVATGYVLLGAALFMHRGQWLFAGLAVLAMFLSGSAEAVFAVGVLAVVVLIRKDWSMKLAVAMFPVVILAASYFGFGAGQELHGLTAWAVTGNEELLPDDRNPDRGTALERRWESISGAVENIEPLGTGYNITDFSSVAMVHNVPLVIVQQLGWGGIVAGIAFLWVSVYCLVRTRWKYVWILVLALCLWDHYIWTQLGVMWWAVVGASTVATESDLIFRRDNGNNQQATEAQ